MSWSWHPSEARADHVVRDDPSVVVANATEDALTGEWRELGVGVAGGGTYCSAFLLVAPLEVDAPALDGNAIFITGWYRTPGAARTRFEARVPLGDGSLRPLSNAIPAITALDGDEAARIVFTRFPTRAFDGVALEQLDSLELGWEVLRNLLGGATARWQQAAP
jgi:hypothetical protein